MNAFYLVKAKFIKATNGQTRKQWKFENLYELNVKESLLPRWDRVLHSRKNLDFFGWGLQLTYVQLTAVRIIYFNSVLINSNNIVFHPDRVGTARFTSFTNKQQKQNINVVDHTHTHTHTQTRTHTQSHTHAHTHTHLLTSSWHRSSSIVWTTANRPSPGCRCCVPPQSSLASSMYTHR